MIAYHTLLKPIPTYSRRAYSSLFQHIPTFSQKNPMFGTRASNSKTFFVVWDRKENSKETFLLLWNGKSIQSCWKMENGNLRSCLGQGSKNVFVHNFTSMLLRFFTLVNIVHSLKSDNSVLFCLFYNMFLLLSLFISYKACL